MTLQLFSNAIIRTQPASQIKSLCVQAKHSHSLEMGGVPSKGNRTSTSLSKHSKVAIGLEQLFDPTSSTYTYLLYDTQTNDAILVDPVDVKIDRDLKIINKKGLNLKYGVNTHAHADHITGTGLLKRQLPGLKSIISKSSTAKADVLVQDGDTIEFGKRHVTVLATPGHTSGCVSLLLDDLSLVLTGDALLINGCGRTDFQGGSAETLYDSIHSQLFTLPNECVVYPAHDYREQTSSTIGKEKENNPRLGANKTREEFVEIMDTLNLSPPKLIDVAVPANLKCGV